MLTAAERRVAKKGFMMRDGAMVIWGRLVNGRKYL